MAARGGVLPAELRREEIIAQLERILADPLFSHSRRFPALLRYVVMQALDQRLGRLKERDLGIEVFGKDPNYDTNADPVVRVTAGEIRKRISRYYSEPDHQGEIRIELAVGSYVPEFRASPESSRAAGVPATLAGPKRRWLVGLAAVLAVACAAGAAWRNWEGRSALDRLWTPAMDSPNAVFVCVGQTLIMDPNRSAQVNFVTEPDVEMLSSIVGYLAARKKPYVVRGALQSGLADLREGPSVVLGAYNNPWVMRMTAKARFSFEADEEQQYIRDRQNPQSREWAADRKTPFRNMDRDYGLVARVLDPDTGRIVMVAGGIHKYGTAAAGEFLTDPKYMEGVAAKAPANWDRKNVQVVLATNVINGNSGAPRVVAVHFW